MGVNVKKVLYILGELTDNDVEWMIEVGRKQFLPTGTTLINEGKTADALYIVLQGTLAVVVEARSMTPIAQLGPGEVVGEMSFIDSRPPSATVRALENALVLAIPRTELNQKLEVDPAFAAHFYRALAVFLSYRLRDSVSQLGYGSAQREPNTSSTDELDSSLMDNVFMAGARFDRMLKRMINS
jgi:CRP/FNR family transcriptional regulator, cyclic AMP receptor protein